ncbi:ElyC/SanA/YdcF family protein [uncultured Clostridium sp.]|uniref:ElyC/SanA/YdcF family protein n=1 Tax=uncultured Clostridium sp. TaxID=59620 RepID=UPI002606A966|nr:ElyC/SanA/YdcF family protein [uncultured Clostridium sp.]
MNLELIADKINILSDFCSKRDLESLNKADLFNTYNINKADLLILFGGSIIEGFDVAGKAFLDDLADNFMLVGGEGHTTEKLRSTVQSLFPTLEINKDSEAIIMKKYLSSKYNLSKFYLEENSTNCGNNVTYALDLIKKSNLSSKNIIIIQDSTMQLRMDAVFKKYDPHFNIINFAPYRSNVIVKNNKLEFEDTTILGMWEIDKFISLLMGEIPRLHDTKDGYGPKGQNFLAHVSIPSKVLEAFNYLKENYKDLTRIANPKFS